jgi:hypothetical protein
MFGQAFQVEKTSLLCPLKQAASRFLKVPFLSSICSVIGVQNPHVSFPHKPAVLYIAYKQAHVAL